MAQRSARIRFDRHAGIDDRVGLAHHRHQPIEIRAAAEHLEEPPLPVQAVVAAGEALRRELGGEHAVLRRARPCAAAWSSMPKFTRMPLEQLAAIDSMCPSWASFSFNSLAAAAAAPNVPMVPEEWKPRVVVLRIDRFGDLALDLEADEERLEKRRARQRPCARRWPAPPTAATASGASGARRCDPGSSTTACRRSPSHGRWRRWPAPRARLAPSACPGRTRSPPSCRRWPSRTRRTMALP